MTPAELRTALTKLNSTQAAMGRLLGYDERTVRRWAAGDRSIPAAVEILLRLLTTRKISGQDIERLRPRG